LKQGLNRTTGYRLFNKQILAQTAAEVGLTDQEVIETRDHASADYLLHYYKIDWADPSLYHLVINTARLSIELATELIIELAHKIQPATQAA
jgi:cytidylate kinase